MKNSYRMAIVTTAAALSAVLLMAAVPALGQAPAPAKAGDTADDKAKAAAKAKRIAEQFEANARVLTVFDREGKTVAEVGERAIYNQPVFSPDRTRVAVIKTDLEAETADLWVIDVGTGKSTRITSSKSREPAQAPVWSPDGKQIAYVALRDSYLTAFRRFSNGEGAEELLYKHPGGNFLLTDWSADGRYLIYSSTDLGGGALYALPLEEKKPMELFRSKFQVLGARISPDNRFIAYRSNETGKNEIFVRSFDPAGAASPAASAGQWQVSNNEGGLGLIFWRADGTELYYMGADRGIKSVSVSTAPAFEFGTPRTLFKLPDAIPVTGTPGGLGNIARDGQRVVFVVPPAPRLQQITVVDRQGKTVRTVGEPGLYGQPALSPDGTRLAVVRNDRDRGNTDIWVFDMATGKGTPVTNDMPPDFGPMWSPDGSQVFYTSLRGNYQGIYRKAWNGTGSEELLFQYTPGAGINLTDVSPDGKFVTFSSGGVVNVVALTGTDPLTRKAIEFSREEFDTLQGRFSPDGRFLAYGSNEGDPEKVQVYVRPFDASTGAAAATGKWQVSKDGANGMLYWRADGKEMFWLHLDMESGDALVMAADISTAPAFQPGTPRLLFRLTNARQTMNGPGSISRDGQRFVFTMMNVPAGTPAK
jgi:Tol biopolymer transport system component